ncbi:CaiB/BaiF CoA-transferase family protein [Arthrobacter sp. BE255]|uniref:CaiB/BaiF CoA transferase family protein n=1 Tax=Arthrobacter sp. BE255 TaxID=2817721 RepID=UPI00285E20E7|nr:CaiB/BaiF CoA-transferase family protein [Arthrobacter sp. BE255]MDR7159110.1 crotonobetainyl-CoA:carnitine CoA-transferase CaiB-like acyl-CoA transferase [Arthrobacter sp. BE255]
MNRLPLEGVKVIEFSHMVMGPAAGLVMADLGADVIKIEPVGDGDKTRRLPGSGAGYFPMFNRNKKSLAVDLKSAEGLGMVRKLIAGADVVTENFRGGVMEKLGLGFEELHQDNPGLVYLSMKGFLKGPYEDRAAMDEVVQMMGGLAYMTGPPGQPLRAGTSVNDIMGGVFGALAVVAALYERGQTGKGQLVRSSLFENNVFLVGQHMAQYGVTGNAARPMPVRLSAWAVYEVFDTADDEKIFIGVVSDTQWTAFCKAFDLADLGASEEYRSNAGRVAGRDNLIPAIRAKIATMTRDEAAVRCEDAVLPFAPINRPEQLFDDPQLAVPGAMTPVTLANGQRLPLPALPMEFDGERLGLRLDLPRAGEHSGSIAESLGYPPEQIDQMFEDGIISSDGAAVLSPSHG